MIWHHHDRVNLKWLSFGKVDGEKPSGFRYIQSAVFGHVIFLRERCASLRWQHPIGAPYWVTGKQRGLYIVKRPYSAVLEGNAFDQVGPVDTRPVALRTNV
jgi:hypothetical protein